MNAIYLSLYIHNVLRFSFKSAIFGQIWNIYMVFVGTWILNWHERFLCFWSPYGIGDRIRYLRLKSEKKWGDWLTLSNQVGKDEGLLGDLDGLHHWDTWGIWLPCPKHGSHVGSQVPGSIGLVGSSEDGMLGAACDGELCGGVALAFPGAEVGLEYSRKYCVG
jgi:hypothetical protein